MTKCDVRATAVACYTRPRVPSQTAVLLQVQRLTVCGGLLTQSRSGPQQHCEGQRRLCWQPAAPCSKHHRAMQTQSGPHTSTMQPPGGPHLPAACF